MPRQSSSTQDLINIDHIKNGAVVLKNGGLRKILLVSGVNFDLKSEEEKNLLIFGYQNFLNSLDFSIQVIIHSRKLNIGGYLKFLDYRRQQEGGSILKNLMSDYQEFIKSFVSQNPIMSKTFFVVVPYDPVQIPEFGRKATKKILGIFSRKTAVVAEPVSNRFEENLKQLNLRVDDVIENLNQIGLRAVPLGEAEIAELFYNFYNPSPTEKKNLQIRNG